MADTVRPVPEGFHTATPHLVVRDPARAIEFYKKAFGAVEFLRLTDPGGNIAHAEFRIGDSPIMIGPEFPEYGALSPESVGGSPVSIHIYVEDVDALVRQAVASGAKVLIPVQDQFYGDRSGRLKDPFGHTWMIATHKEDLTPEDMQKRFEAFMKQQGGGAEQGEQTATPVKPIREGFHTITPYLIVQDAAGLIDFVKQAFGAEELLRAGPGSAGGIHAEVRIGDSKVMIGGGGSLRGRPMRWRGKPMPTALHLYVEDADAVYRRALEAGATSIEEPVDQPYGDREAGVKDVSGNHWYIATHKGARHIPEGLRSVTPYLHPRGAAELIDFLKQAFAAEEVGRFPAPDGAIAHAQIRIGNSILEMGEAHGEFQPMPTMIFLAVSDADAWYRRALEAGATSVQEPANQPYGPRMAAVADPFGNHWYMATQTKDVTS